MRQRGRRAARLGGLVGIALGVPLALGCEAVSRPNRPLPDDFEVKLLSGERRTSQDFKGRPWVIALWVPG